MQVQFVRIINMVQTIGSYFCRILQKVLVVVIFFLFGIFSYFYLQYLFFIPPRKQPYDVKLKILYLIVGIIFLYNLVYNYVMANRIGPGFAINLPTSSMEKYNIIKRCKKCQQRKPIRTHHCSVCDKCILQMDHHCPWMGTCIGHNNRRYFILFLTYLTFSVFLVINLMITFDLPKNDVFIFLLTIGIVIGLFSLYHWAIALWGRTTLQFCQIFDGYQPSKSISTNFLIIFGTKNIFMAFLPVHIPLTYEGCQWNNIASRSQLIPVIQNDQSLFVNTNHP